jgi:hypothetical protein
MTKAQIRQHKIGNQVRKLLIGKLNKKDVLGYHVNLPQNGKFTALAVESIRQAEAESKKETMQPVVTA